MLFLYRPRQTWMPFRPPRPRTDQDGYNVRMQRAYSATHRVAPYTPAASGAAGAEDPVARLRELAQLHDEGALSDAEFAAAKAKVLGLGESAR
jgi:Short C-terminal domain